MGILNQYSYILFAVALGAGLGLALWRWRRAPWALRVGLLMIFVVAAVGVGMSRRYPTPQVTTLTAAETVLSNEQPTFVMLYSNY